MKNYKLNRYVPSYFIRGTISNGMDNNDEYNFMVGEDIEETGGNTSSDSVCPRCGLRTYDEFCPSCGTPIVDKSDDEEEEYDWREKHR